MENEQGSSPIGIKGIVLIVSMGVVAACGLCYEYLISTYAGYTRGSAFKEVFLIITLMMFAMGIGTLITQKLERNLLEWFIGLEMLIALIGGISILFISWGNAVAGYLPQLLTQVLVGSNGTQVGRGVLFDSLFFERLSGLISYSPYVVAMIIGILVGMEIPFAIRILDSYRVQLKRSVSYVMSADYMGALLGGLVWIMIFIAMPLTKAGFILGLVNGGVALVCLAFFFKEIKLRKIFVVANIVIIAGLFLGFSRSADWEVKMEQLLYSDKVIYTAQTPYQRMVITEWKAGKEIVNDFFINGNLQMSSRDEYRYHELLVHPAILLSGIRHSVLILGGGDGLAAREVLKYPSVRKVVLVDIDKELTNIFTEIQYVNGWMVNKHLLELNRYSLSDPRVQVVNRDAYIWLDETSTIFDVIIIDFPDPNHIELNKLYSWGFYKKLQRHLSANGFIAIQATSPVHSREAFLSIGKTMRAAGLRIIPYHANIPSFGEWGWYLAWNNGRWSVHNIREQLAAISDKDITFETKYLTPDVIKAVQLFGKGELDDRHIKVNYRSDPQLISYYEKGWKEDY